MKNFLYVFSIMFFLISFSGGAHAIRMDDDGEIMETPPPPPQKTTWYKTYGGNDSDIFNDISNVENNEFVVVGTKDKTKDYKGNVWLVKFDMYGNLLWEKILNTNSYGSKGKAIERTLDGGYIVMAIKFSKYGSQDTWIIKLNQAGDIQWEKDVESSITNAIYVVPDGSFIFAGIQQTLTEKNLWMFRLDSNGNQIWYNPFPAPNCITDRNGITGNGDSVYFITEMLPDEKGIIATQVQITNLEGKRLKSITIHETFGSRSGMAILPVMNDYLIFGEYEHRKNCDGWIYRIDATGRKIWEKTYGTNTATDEFFDAAIAPDGNFIVVGTTWENGSNDANIMIYKIGTEGNVIWKKTHGGPHDDSVYSVSVTPDGRILAVGDSLSWSTNKQVEAVIFCLTPDGDLTL
jgi:WD40 repeat protein